MQFFKDLDCGSHKNWKTFFWVEYGKVIEVMLRQSLVKTSDTTEQDLIIPHSAKDKQRRIQMTDALDVVVRPVLLLARFLLWLIWDWFFDTIAWWVGWPVCRTLSLGHFPATGFNSYEESDFGEAIMVCATGILFLLGVIWLLADYLKH
jgi:hypothetical protein